jgi:hypothetical protein
MSKIIHKAFPAAKKGIPYKECIDISGTLPIVTISHNLGDYGTVEMVGNSLCVTIKDPQYDVDVSVQLRGSCLTCRPVTVVGSITVDGVCDCVPVSFGSVVLPAREINSYISVAIPILGTPPIVSAGGSAPKGMRIRLDGSMIVIDGTYCNAGDIKFSVKNDCTCEPVSWNWSDYE